MADRVIVLWGTGKRKSSVARVRLRPGDGTIVVNERPLDNYFGRETSRMIVQQPFEVTSTQGSYRADVNVCGGGGVAPARADRARATRPRPGGHPAFSAPLQKGGLLTRRAPGGERQERGRDHERQRPAYRQ